MEGNWRAEGDEETGVDVREEGGEEDNGKPLKRTSGAVMRLWCEQSTL